MLWRLIKILVFVAVVAALSFATIFLLEANGTLQITVAQTEFTLGPLAAVVLVLVLFVAVWLVLRLVGLIVAFVRFLRGDETALTRYFTRHRERKGIQALSDSLLALASGEGRRAMSKAQKAERYLRRPDVTDLLVAQSAELTGDRAKAETIYRRMVGGQRTRFVGVRGLMLHRLGDGDTETALKLAERAFALKPHHEATQDTLLRLQAGKEDWAGARRTLNAKLRHGNLPRGVHKRRDAVLAVAEARDKLAADRPQEAHASAIEANRLSPELIPAAVMAAQAYVAQGKPRYASRVVSRAWSTRPHPDLAAAFAEIVPDETPAKRLKRFRTLTRTHPDDPETRLLTAELSIAAEDFPAARRAIGDLAERAPTTRTLAIMAAIERGEGAKEDVVRGWLTRALTAPRGPQWICTNCGTAHGEWLPVCRRCAAFDSLGWREPEAGPATIPHSAEMLPLLVAERDGGDRDEAETVSRPPAEATPHQDPETGDADTEPPRGTQTESARGAEAEPAGKADDTAASDRHDADRQTPTAEGRRP